MEQTRRRDREKASSGGWIALVYEALEVAGLALLAVVLFGMWFRPVQVDGRSMETTLMDGDDLLLLTPPFYTPRPEDIVVLRRPDGAPLIKRVIAVGGDTIFFDKQTQAVSRNGTVLQEGYLTDSHTDGRDVDGTLQIPPGYVFVMGDNRAVSLDSRSQEVGLIREEDIIGRAFFRLWPPTFF